MTTNITIIGLGQIGASIGLAFADKQTDVRRVGHDKDPETAKLAKKQGAVDDIKYNLPASVENAAVVILCLPLDQIRPTLEIIAQDLKEGAVVIDVSPAKSLLANWVKDILPAGRYYVGVTPALNPAYLHEIESGIGAAHADLFNGATLLLDTPLDMPEQAVNLASNLTNALGAKSMFSDSAEADGMMASVHLLPQLAAAALLNSTLEQPGWQETRKIASKPYALATAALVDADALREAVLSNKENTLRVLDAFIASLTNLREAIADNSNTDLLGKRLKSAHTGRLNWWIGRSHGAWKDTSDIGVEMPTFGSQIKQTFLGNRKKPTRE
jgi:prephenate dehydrogenase